MADKVLFLKPPLGATGRNIVRDFVYGCWCNGRRIGGMQMPPLNDLYVATHSRQEGVNPVFCDAGVEPGRFETLMATGLKDFFALVILSSTQSFRADIACIAQVKAVNPEITAILFGSHPTFMPRYCLVPEVDYIVLREPEETIRQLLGRLARGEDPSDLAGLGTHGPDAAPVINEPRPYMDLDDLPIPDRTMLPKGLDYFNPVVKRMPYTTMQTSRGCPARCIFCTVPVFYGKEFRHRSAGSVLEELRRIRAMGYREVFIRDETFTAATERNKAICEGMIREKMDLSWIANSRVNTVDKEMMRLMRRAGCHILKFGVETSSDEILLAYRKGATAQQAEKAFAAAREVGLNTHAHIVMGGPGETPQTLQDTIDFVKKIGASTASFGILTPYPGTKLFEMVADKHPEILDGSESTMANLHTEGFYSSAISGLSGEELSSWIIKAYRQFYWRPGYIARKLAGIRSLDEFMSLVIAGMNILNFTVSGKK